MCGKGGGGLRWNSSFLFALGSSLIDYLLFYILYPHPPVTFIPLSTFPFTRLLASWVGSCSDQGNQGEYIPRSVGHPGQIATEIYNAVRRVPYHR